ncbi:MAG: glycoside hydrolase family 130 protein [Ilumatobacteraceae bacterium]
MELRVTRCESVRLVPDPRRVITKSFVPREEIYADGSTRMDAVLTRLLAMSDDDVGTTLDDARRLFDTRHRDLEAIFEASFGVVAAHLDQMEASGPSPIALTGDRRQLIGAYFTHEYSIEAAALGNPSIVLAPDQSDVGDGDVRVVVSLRAVGEGHTSSIEFRSGVVGADGSVRLDPPSPFAVTGDPRPAELDTSLFTAKLSDLGMLNDVAARVLARLPDRFTIADVEAATGLLEREGVERSISGETTRLVHWLASSSYHVSFPVSLDISERVLFPRGPAESHGMEDARFVRFVDDDGAVTFYATYTGFDGHQILPQLLETRDFTEFQVSTLGGRAARNKGIAIFPRRIDGRYAALGRHDNVSNFLMMSDDVRVWNDSTVVQQPERPWELMQLGNCGSPLETEAGWLVITHGVGPLRRYSLGALLLDLDDPTRVVGHLDEPLLSPNADEREGYVPNVVYSCGSMIHRDHVILPYGFADVGAGVATISLEALLTKLTDRRTSSVRARPGSGVASS